MIEHIFDEINRASKHFTTMQESVRKGFPAYNVVKTSDTNFKIELASAGYKLSDFDITVDDTLLTIKANPRTTAEVPIYLYQGLTAKAWVRDFVLQEGILVNGAEYVDGILTVFLNSVATQPKKPVKINIAAPSAKAHPTLLNEDSSM